MQHDVSKDYDMLEHMKDAATWLGVVWGTFSIAKGLAAVGIHSWADLAGVASVVTSVLVGAYHLWKWRREARRKVE